MRFIVTLGAALVGGVVGYFIGAYAGCDWLMPKSNLCGIYGAVTGPIGLVGCAVFAWMKARSR